MPAASSLAVVNLSISLTLIFETLRCHHQLVRRHIPFPKNKMGRPHKAGDGKEK
jgi:hypothetical protein